MATTISGEMAALCAWLEQWRKNGGGGRGKRIPETVWQQAAAVARVDGVHATALATRLNYERLKASVASYPSSDSEALAQSKKQRLLTPSSAQFVSVQMAPVAPRHAMTIELTSRSGERIRVESSDALDLAEVLQSFWSRRS